MSQICPKKNIARFVQMWWKGCHKDKISDLFAFTKQKQKKTLFFSSSPSCVDIPRCNPIKWICLKIQRHFYGVLRQ